VNFDFTTTLRTCSDIVQLTFPSDDGQIFVLQLGDTDQNIIVKHGGDFVFELLDLCDGTRSFGDVVNTLKSRFAGREALWSEEIFNAVDRLLAWRVLEAIDP